MHLGFRPVPVPELKIAIDPETGNLILPEINGNFFRRLYIFHSSSFKHYFLLVQDVHSQLLFMT